MSLFRVATITSGSGELHSSYAALYGLEAVGGMPLDKEEKEEIVINQITNGLMQVFRDNKWLLDFLKEKTK